MPKVCSPAPPGMSRGMTEPAPSQREADDLRPVPPGKPGVNWTAMRIALVIVVVGVIAVVIWLATSAS